MNSPGISVDYFDGIFYRAKQNAFLIMDCNGIIESVSPSFTELFGFTESDLKGKFTGVLFTKEDNDRGLPQIELNNVLKAGESRDNNYLVHKDQTIHWVSGESIVAGKDGNSYILKIIQDIHSHKSREQLLGAINELNDSILKSIQDVVLVLSADFAIIKANKAFLNLFTREPEPEKLNFINLIKPYDPDNDLIGGIEKVISSRFGFSDKELEIKSFNGEKRIYIVSCIPMEGNSNVLLVVRDITGQRFADRQREDIIGFVAHELRNPLANLILCNELLNDIIREGNVIAAQELLVRSKNNILRLNKMISELYDSTKIGAGQMQLELSEFNFGDMVKEAIGTVEGLQPGYRIKLHGHANHLVQGDRHRLIQVITNFLNNGIKYSNGSSVVDLSIKEEGTQITVSVTDKGLGIPADQLPYVFNRFFRAEKTRNLEGVGLGLYLCRQIIKAHKGSIWAESQEGKGSTFYFSIPIIPIKK